MKLLDKFFGAINKRRLPTEPADHAEFYNALIKLSDEQLASELQSVKDLAMASEYPEGAVPAWIQWQHAAITEIMENRRISNQEPKEISVGRMR